MKKLLLVGLLALGACTTTQIDAQVKQVQDTAVAICRYLPTAAAVASILSNAPIISTTASVAGDICNAVTNLPLAEGPGKRQAVVYGVLVRGRFVK